MFSDLERFFKDCLTSMGHPLDKAMVFDTDNWQRYPCPGSKHSKTSARYRAHSDDRPVIKFYCKKCEIKRNFCYQSNKPYYITPEQQVKNNQKIVEEKKKRAEFHAQCLIELQAEWDSALPCLNHKYFDRKCLVITESDGLRIDKQGRILCPLRTIDGKLVSTQRVPYKGLKLFDTGLPTAGGFHVFGNLDHSHEIFFAEGVATALTVKMVTAKACVCCYGKRFAEIAPIIAKVYPNKKFIFCCDLPSAGEKITSADTARKAISLVGGTYVLPDFSVLAARG